MSVHFVCFWLTGLPDGYSADHVADGQVVEVFLLLEGSFGRHDDGVSRSGMDFVAGFEGEFIVSGEGGPSGRVEVGHGRGSLLAAVGNYESVPLHLPADITK
jgi:hypothetical protein